MRVLWLPGLLLLLNLADLLVLRPLWLSLLRPLLPRLWWLCLADLPDLLLWRPLLRSLLDPLLPWLLSGLSVPLCLRLFLLLLCACLRLLLLFRLALFSVLLVVLRVRRDNRPEKQKQGGRTGSSNKLHSNHLRSPLRSPLGMHADDQSASTLFHASAASASAWSGYGTCRPERRPHLRLDPAALVSR